MGHREERRGIDSFDVEPAQPYDGPIRPLMSPYEPAHEPYQNGEDVTVRPGDILIVRYSRVVSAEEAERTKAQLKERLPGIRDVVVIEADELAVYRPDQVDGDGEHAG